MRACLSLRASPTEVGATGYIMKDSPRAELVKAINKVIEGGVYSSPALAERLVIDLGSGTDGAPHEALSDREFEVMRLNQQIQICSANTDKTIRQFRTKQSQLH